MDIRKGFLLMTDKIQELIDKRAQLWNAAKTFLDERTDKDGKLSAEDAAAYDKMRRTWWPTARTSNALSVSAVWKRNLRSLRRMRL